jgi:hypothetical protein
MMWMRNCCSRSPDPARLTQIGSSSTPVNSESLGELTNLQYWWVFSVSLLAPLASIWIESSWVFGREMRPYQALIFHFDNTMLWIISGFEFFFTMSSLILLQRWLKSVAIRWGIAFCFYALWTYLAFLSMPQVHK